MPKTLNLPAIHVESSNTTRALRIITEEGASMTSPWVDWLHAVGESAQGTLRGWTARRGIPAGFVLGTLFGSLEATLASVQQFESPFHTGTLVGAMVGGVTGLMVVLNIRLFPVSMAKGTWRFLKK